MRSDSLRQLRWARTSQARGAIASPTSFHCTMRPNDLR